MSKKAGENDPHFKPTAPPGKHRVIGSGLIEGDESWLVGDYPPSEAEVVAAQKVNEASGHVIMQGFDDHSNLVFEVR